MPFEVLEVLPDQPKTQGFDILEVLPDEASPGFEVLEVLDKGEPAKEFGLKRPAPTTLYESIAALPAGNQTPIVETSVPGIASDLASGEGPGVFETLMEPMVNFPAIHPDLLQGPMMRMLPGDTGKDIATGAGRFISKAASSMTSPGMIGLLGVGAISPPIAAAAIAAMGAHGVGPAVVDAIEASKEGDLARFTESTLDAAMAATMTSAGARGTISGLKPSPPVKEIHSILDNARANGAAETAKAFEEIAAAKKVKPVQSILLRVKDAAARDAAITARGEAVERLKEGEPPTPTEPTTPAPEDAPFNLAGETTRDGARLESEQAKATADAAEVKRIADEQQPGLIGMGGAVPSEFGGTGGSPTAMKYKLIDQERAQRGLEPLIKPQGLSDAQALQKAMAKQDMEPVYVETLIKDIRENPRVIEDWENHLLNLRKIDLRNELHRSMRDGLQAAKDGRLDDVEAITPRTQIWSDKLAEVEEASRLSGSKRGSALRSLQVMINEDFSLEQMKMTRLADRKFKQLSPEAEAAENVELARKSEALLASNKAFEARVAELEKLAANAEVQKAIDAAKASTPPVLYPKPVLEAAERIVQGWEKRGEAASVRLRAKLAQLGTTPDPTIVIDLAEIGIAKLGRGALDLAKWTETMLAEFGPKIEPFLKDGFEAAQKLLNIESEKIKGPISEQVKRKIRNVDVAEKITDAKEKIGLKIERWEGEEVAPNVNALVHALVEQDPNISRDTLVDTVHGILKDFLPEITRQEAADSISGRGKFWTPPQDAVSKTVRDLKTQIRLVEHQQDVLAGKPLPRTGYQPEPLSDAARQEQAKLNELKRKYGVIVTDPASQLASTLAARKTYYRHRISDLEQEISTRERIVKTKSPSPTDAELEALKAEHKRLKIEEEEVFGKREMTPEQRAAVALKAVERSITELERQIKTGDVGPKSRASKTPNTPELEAARSRRGALRAELDELRDLANPKKTPEQRALAALKTRLTKSNADLADRLARGDFSPKPKRPPIDVSKDPEAMRLKSEHESIKNQFLQERARDAYNQMTAGQKAWANFKEVFNLRRNFMTAFDLSAVGKQGILIGAGNPARAVRNVGGMLKALTNEKRALAIEQSILHRPNAPLYARSKLFLQSLSEARLSAQEEATMSRLASRIPGLRASNRAYVTFLNLVRADTFDAMLENLPLKERGAATQFEMEVIARGINDFTGRGYLGKTGERGGELLSTFFFAPRYVVSRFRVAAGIPLYRGTARTRLAFAKEYAKTLTGIGVLYGLAELGGATVEDDTRSSDFGKFKWGHSRLDPIGGVAQITTFVSRITTGKTKTLRTGKLAPIRGPQVPYGGQTVPGEMGRFLRTKIAPVLGDVVDVLAGENVVGEKVTVGSKLLELPVPIAYQDIYDVMLEQGIPAGTALELLNILGMSLQHFDENKRQK